MFSDLECDYINPIDLCNKLNQVRTKYRERQSVSLMERNLSYPVCFTGDAGTRFLDPVLPAIWPMASILAECSASRVQCQQVRNGSASTLWPHSDPMFAVPQDHHQEPHVRCNRDLPNIVRSQEGKLYQARSLSCVILLLSLPVGTKHLTSCFAILIKRDTQNDLGFDCWLVTADNLADAMLIQKPLFVSISE
jgi:hypothetical protein